MKRFHIVMQYVSQPSQKCIDVLTTESFRSRGELRGTSSGPRRRIQATLQATIQLPLGDNDQVGPKMIQQLSAGFRITRLGATQQTIGLENGHGEMTQSCLSDRIKTRSLVAAGVDFTS